MANEPLFLSVVIISFNQKDHVARLIPQLLAQDLPASSYEIIVVDDGSTDGSRDHLRTLPAHCRVIFGETDKGRSASRNRGIRAAQGEIVVMIDGDHTIEPDFLSIHAERHRQERCVLVGKSIFVDHPDYRAINLYLNGGGATKLEANARLPGRYFLTRNCSLPRDLLLTVGLFDEAFTSWGGEDLDLGVRLEESGVPIYGEPRALAVHHHLRPLAAVLRNVYEYGRTGIPLLLRKHPRLFQELNLDRSLLDRTRGSRFNWLYRSLVKLSFQSPFFVCTRLFAELFRRYRLPRLVFDYLHLREYTRGYQAHLRTP